MATRGNTKVSPSLISTGSFTGSFLATTINANVISCSVITGSLYGPQILTANTTVTLSNSMTTAQMQSIIDSQPKNLNGKSLTFAFSDGSYVLSGSPLTFECFSNGYVNINGNSANTSSNIDKNVVIRGAINNHVIYLVNNPSNITVNNIKFVVTCSNNKSGIYIDRTHYAYVNYCAFTNANSSSAVNTGYGPSNWASRAHVLNSKFSYLDNSIVCGYAATLISENQSTVANSFIALISNAGTIFRIGTQPSATNATATYNGGQIL